MAGRFGERTRVTEAVSGFGQRATAGGGGALTFNQQEFLAPGTWTKPANASQVWVFIVGGGGGGGATSLLPPAIPLPSFSTVYAGGGGGGGVRSGWVPVSAPVSVTIGAGGTGAPASGPGPTQIATVGGTTSFGPTFSVGGGGLGNTPYTASYTPTISAPPVGGGSGGGSPGGPVPGQQGGQYGFPSFGPPNNIMNTGAGVTSSNQGPLGLSGGNGYLIYGAGGGGSTSNIAPTARVEGLVGAGAGLGYRAPGISATPGVANTGGGGGGGGCFQPTSPEIPLAPGGNGGSGYCLVRWLE